MSNRDLFNDIRKIVGSLDQVQVDSINGILSNARREGVDDPVLQGYMLSTGWLEARLRPVREGFKKTDEEARKYVKRHYSHKYGKPAGPYGHWYYGRGLVQLTWHHNYKASSADVGVDLEKYPDKALEPAIASRLLVRGMMDGRWNGRRKGLADYLGNGKRDYKNARRTVNVTDKWTKFRDVAKQFTAALEAHPYQIETTQPEPPKKKGGLWGLIVSALGLGGGGAASTMAPPEHMPLIIALALLAVVAGLGAFVLARRRAKNA